MAVAQVPNVYRTLDVKTFINASGHNTAQGGSLMPREVLAAMEEAARHYVSLRALQDAAGRHIAGVAGAPAALVSSGAAGAILLAAAGCLTGTDAQATYVLPETPPDGRNQIVVWRAPGPNYMYQACRAAGAKLVEIGEPGGSISPELFRDAIAARPGRVAAVLLILAPIDQGHAHTGGWEPFIGGVARYAAAAGVPVLVDAAAELPPRNLIRRLLDLGTAAVIVSGGKAIRGPQSTGLLLGRSELVAAAALNNNPLSAIGRPMKVGKEEICGLVAAVDRFFAMDEAAQLAEWRAAAARIAGAVPGRSTVRAEVVANHADFGRPPIAPKAVLHLDGEAAAQALAAELSNGEPAIQPHRVGPHLIFNPMTIEPGEAETIAARLRSSL